MDEAKVIQKGEAPAKPAVTPPAERFDFSRTAAEVSRLANIAAEAASARAVVKTTPQPQAPAARLSTPDRASDTAASNVAKLEVPVSNRTIPAADAEPAAPPTVYDEAAEARARAEVKQTGIALKVARQEAERLQANEKSDPKSVKKAEVAAKKAEAAWKRAKVVLRDIVESNPEAAANAAAASATPTASEADAKQGTAPAPGKAPTLSLVKNAAPTVEKTTASASADGAKPAPAAAPPGAQKNVSLSVVKPSTPEPAKPTAPASTAAPVPAVAKATPPAVAKVSAPAVAKPAGPVVAKAPAPAVPAPAKIPEFVPAPNVVPLTKTARLRKKVSWTQLSFLAAVIVPVLLVGLYYLFIASDQYRSEMRFAVRGTERSTLENLGLNAIPGATEQAGDAYIVIDYIHSKQILLDIQDKLGIDMRQFFSKPGVDLAYRIDPNMPLDKFIEYWRWMIDASYNSTTSITTFQVNAFTGDDAAAIATAVLKVSNELVNDLSTKARLQLISNAQSEVTRTEDRLIKARQELTAFRNLIGTPDPTMVAVSDQAIIQELEKQVLDRKSRRASLISTTVDSNSPSVRVLDRQIEALSTLLEEKRRAQGSSDGETAANQLTQYNALVLEQEFAEKAYTTALSSLETSQAEARRQDRYFAIAVEPSVPEIPLYPLGTVNTLIAFFAFAVLWLVGYLIAQAIRDHTA